MKSIYTSPNTVESSKTTTQGCEEFDVNARAIIGFRDIGCGFSAIERFSFIMNLKCLSSFPFKQLNKKGIYFSLPGMEAGP